MKYLVAALLVTACTGVPTPPPVVPPPDAHDSAPPLDAPAPAACEAACAKLGTLCGAQSAGCVEVWQKINDKRLIREPSGRALSCSDVAMAGSSADVRALGADCP